MWIYLYTLFISYGKFLFCLYLWGGVEGWRVCSGYCLAYLKSELEMFVLLSELSYLETFHACSTCFWCVFLLPLVSV